MFRAAQWHGASLDILADTTGDNAEVVLLQVATINNIVDIGSNMTNGTMVN
eukprot:CAMPEP_0196156840 /NCGR_PEP_ID=MMETSP0910-20130528/43002_1 /TAXON_ID=49265 /ORGANISM="Thalassiosira rotula, Strain GSO102" /LENGTH=50 /DNA_ID=CAMNT_0041421385 /DNA_START=105 /DNA_END=254 /DNA_ORIENTATION=-